MHHFRYVRGRLYCEGVSVESLAKQRQSVVCLLCQDVDG